MRTTVNGDNNNMNGDLVLLITIQQMNHSDWWFWTIWNVFPFLLGILYSELTNIFHRG